MANFALNPVWRTGVYQLETSDPVVGGADGVSNRASRQLSERTDFLKSALDLAFGDDYYHENGTLKNEIVLPVSSGGTGLKNITAGRILVGGADNTIEQKTLNQLMGGQQLLSYFSTIPLVESDPVIYVIGKGLLEWRTIGSWSGYASLWLGKYEFDTSTVSRSLTIEAVGGIFSKTTYPALWAWAQANNHVVAASSWVAKEFKFADLGGNNFKVPDMRNVFIRGTGTDADNANVRALGSYQADEIRAHTHAIGTLYYNYNGSSVATNASNGNRTETAPFGGAETRGENVALAPRIIAY